MMPAPRLLPILALAAGIAVAAAGSPRANPAAVAAGDVVLVDFSASWCGPCRQMAPLIGEITAAGWVVRHVDVDREAELVRRFGVTGVPCYVLLVRGQEVGRINGATTRGELETLLAKSRQPLGLAPAATPSRPQAAAGIPLAAAPAAAPLATDAPAPSPPRQPALIAPPAADVAAVRERSRALPRTPPPPAAVAAAAAEGLDPQSRAALENRLMNATARLLVEDGKGVSRGTGTVIDCRQGEALILTCGHIFRDSQGKGRVEVDLFGPGAPRGVAGQVVAWDLKRDLALVSIFTDRQVEPIRVGGVERRTTPGEPVVSVGCDGGDDPTVHHSRITAVDKYLGPANVQVAGQPVQGRSGGGLFAVDGTLIGVCNAADPAENEGLFAALPTIHEQLDEAGLAFVYRSVYPSGGVGDIAAAGPLLPSMPAEMPPVSFDRRDRADSLPTAATIPTAAAMAPATVSPPPGSAPREPQPQPTAPRSAAESLTPGEQALVDHVWRNDDGAEVICIVRPRGGQPAPSEVFVLQGTGRELAEQLARARSATPRPRADTATLPAGNPVR
jgi:thiol-disulfide isomerase/thioredoxin